MKIQIAELGAIDICWETCPGGIHREYIYDATPEPREDVMYGWRIDGGLRPIRIVFDGLAYPKNITEEDLVEKLGEEEYQRHKARAQAAVVLLGE